MPRNEVRVGVAGSLGLHARPSALFQERTQSRADLGRVRELEIDRNVVGLIHMLDSDLRGRSDTSIVRDHAARALGRMGDPPAIPYLMEMRDDPEEHVRVGVWSAPGRSTRPWQLRPASRISSFRGARARWPGRLGVALQAP